MSDKKITSQFKEFGKKVVESVKPDCKYLGLCSSAGAKCWECKNNKKLKKDYFVAVNK